MTTGDGWCGTDGDSWCSVKVSSVWCAGVLMGGCCIGQRHCCLDEGGIIINGNDNLVSHIHMVFFLCT